MSLGGAVAAAGGALVAAGLIAVAGDRWAETGSSGGPLAVTGALLVGTALAAARAAGPAQAAAVAASGLAAPAVAFFATAGGGIPSPRETALAGAVLLAGLYLVGPWRGHTFHLAVLVGAGWVFALASGDAGSLVGGFGTLADLVAGAGVASLVTGGLYLGTAGWLHARDLRGMATPFLAVGTAALAVGSVAAVQDELPTALALALVGVAVAAVGGWARRRGTTWIGVGLVGAGIAAAGLAAGAGGVEVPALVAVAAGVVLVALAPLAGTAVGERREP